MSGSIIHKPDPKLDLMFERFVDVPRELVWMAWTKPEHLKKWFTPVPWKTVDCEIELHPGGMFRTVMRSPEGEEFPNVGCYLEMPCDTFFFTAVIALETHGGGTKYTALVIHGDEDARKKHEEMGFYEGWGKTLDQLVAHAKNM